MYSFTKPATTSGRTTGSRQEVEAEIVREIIVLALLCLLLALGAFVVLAWAALAGSILTMDGLLLASVCLLLGAIFSFCFLWLARDAHLWDMVKGPRRAPSNPKNSDASQ